MTAIDAHFASRLPALRQDAAYAALTIRAFAATPAKSTFRRSNGIPWMFADPDASLGEWRGRLQHGAANSSATRVAESRPRAHVTRTCGP